VFLLDRSDNSINRYDFDGSYFDTRIQGSMFQNTTAFSVVDNNDFWISDLYGSRLTRISNGRAVLQIHSDFCYWGVTFFIDEVATLESGHVMRAADRGGNYILEFGG
jgi:hypothetical protein